jgi:uncharacterized protein (TIGR00251 family)
VQDGALTFAVRVVPRASRSEVAGEHDGALRVRVAAPPVDGAANEELIRTLARALRVPARDVRIMSGHEDTKTRRPERQLKERLNLISILILVS